VRLVPRGVPNDPGAWELDMFLNGLLVYQAASTVYR